MPTIYVKLQHNAQMGYNDTGANFAVGGANMGVKTDRVFIMRYPHIPIPKGSTINNAWLYFVWSVKNDGTQSMQLTPYMDGNLSVYNPWLDTSKNEWSSATRTWSNHGVAAASISWQVGGPTRQLSVLNIKPHLTAAAGHANWTLAGGSATFLMSCASVTNSDSQYVHTLEDGWGPLLEIDYTPPASDGKSTVVNLQENQNFDRAANSQGAFDMSPWGFNQWYGAFTQPAYSILNSMPVGMPAPPGGGKILEITPQNGRPMVHNGVPALDEGDWHNFSCYVFMPATNPAAQEAGLTVLGHRSDGDSTAVKGSWQRIGIDFIAGNGGHWCTVQGNGSGFTWDATTKFYVANAQITKGRMMRPYIHGGRVLANADHGWAGSNTGGFVRAVPPTVLPSVSLNKARRKSWVAGWTYSSTAGHSQIYSNVKVKKVQP